MFLIRKQLATLQRIYIIVKLYQVYNILLMQKVSLKKYLPASFFSNFQKGLGNLKFDHLYQFNQYPMQEFFNQFSFLKEEIDAIKIKIYDCSSIKQPNRTKKNCQRFLMNIALKLTIVIKVKSVKELSILLKETFVMVFILWMRILYSSLNMKFSKRGLNANTEDKILAMLKD